MTSIDLQNQSWLDYNNINPHWSFIEFINTYFNDLLCNFDYKYFIDKNYVSLQEYEIIEEWHTALAEYNAPKNEDFDHKEILNDPMWLKLVEKGKMSKEKLKLLLNNEELSILNKKQ